uniref:Spike glycoprotein fusion domain-containing protein n=1 Tax=Ditylenchus dipsaci TaxID=166011 RepID=A0A915D6B0_9BILA
MEDPQHNDEQAMLYKIALERQMAPFNRTYTVYQQNTQNHETNGYYCFKVKESTTSYTNLLGDPFLDESHEPLTVSAEECTKMVNENMCSEGKWPQHWMGLQRKTQLSQKRYQTDLQALSLDPSSMARHHQPSRRYLLLPAKRWKVSACGWQSYHLDSEAFRQQAVPVPESSHLEGVVTQQAWMANNVDLH